MVDCWSPLTHASHCMIISSHTDESESKPSYPLQGIFTPDAFPAATSLLLGLRSSSEYAGLYILKQGY